MEATVMSVDDCRFLPWLSIHQEIAIWRRRAEDVSLTVEERERYRLAAKRLSDAQWEEEW